LLICKPDLLVKWRKWLFVDSIKIKLDGKMYEFKSSKNKRDVKDGGYIQELNIYAVDRNFIELMASSKKIEIRLQGEKDYLTMNYDDKYYQLLKDFLIKTK